MKNLDRKNNNKKSRWSSPPSCGWGCTGRFCLAVCESPETSGTAGRNSLPAADQSANRGGSHTAPTSGASKHYIKCTVDTSVEGRAGAFRLYFCWETKNCSCIIDRKWKRTWNFSKFWLILMHAKIADADSYSLSRIQALNDQVWIRIRIPRLRMPHLTQIMCYCLWLLFYF